MKMNFAGLLPNPNVKPENFRYNCIRNKACQMEFFIPVENLCDFMLYFDLPFMPISYTIHVVDSCTGLELVAHVINYVVGSHTKGFYAIFAGLTNGMLPPLFYIKASFFDVNDIEAVFYSNDFEIVTCEPLTKVYSCYNDPAPGTDAFDMNGVYYGYPTTLQTLGNAGLRYYHFLKVRKGSVLGNKTKLSLSAFNTSKIYKGQATQQYNFFSESVPEFYKEEILAVIARGNIQINEKPYQVADEIEISLVDEDSQRWAMNVTLNKTIFNYYSCRQTTCAVDPCQPVTEPVQCCDPVITSVSVDVFNTPPQATTVAITSVSQCETGSGLTTLTLSGQYGTQLLLSLSLKGFFIHQTVFPGWVVTIQSHFVAPGGAVAANNVSKSYNSFAPSSEVAVASELPFAVTIPISGTIDIVLDSTIDHAASISNFEAWLNVVSVNGVPSNIKKQLCTTLI